jgi:hypothetical protein
MPDGKYKLRIKKAVSFLHDISSRSRSNLLHIESKIIRSTPPPSKPTKEKKTEWSQVILNFHVIQVHATVDSAVTLQMVASELKTMISSVQHADASTLLFSPGSETLYCRLPRCKLPSRNHTRKAFDNTSRSIPQRAPAVADSS